MNKTEKSPQANRTSEKASRRQPPRTVPPASELERRWRILTLLADLVLRQDEMMFKRYRIDRRGIGRGEHNDYVGSFASFVCYPKAALFYGSCKDSLYVSQTEETLMEWSVRKKVSKLPKEVRSLLEPPSRWGSMGWTFAMWSAGPHEPWQDLTGRDRGCWRSAQSTDSCWLFDGPEVLGTYVTKSLERPDLVGLVDQIVRFVPLTKAMAVRMMRNRRKDASLALLKANCKDPSKYDKYEPTLEFARNAALRAGYPLAAEWFDLDS